MDLAATALYHGVTAVVRLNQTGGGQYSSQLKHTVDDVPRHGLPGLLLRKVLVRPLHQHQLAVGHQRSALLRLLQAGGWAVG